MRKRTAVRRVLNLAVAAAVASALGHSARAGDQDLSPVSDTSTPGLLGRYFTTGATTFGHSSQIDYTGTPGATRIDGTGTNAPNQTWNNTNEPPGGVATVNGNNRERFATQFLGKMNFATAGAKSFTINSDDGARVFIDNILVFHNEGGQGGTNITNSINLTAGLHDLRIDFVQGTGGAKTIFTSPAGTTYSTTGSTNAYEADVLLAGTSTVIPSLGVFNVQLNNPHLFTSVGLDTLGFVPDSTLSVTGFDTGTSSAADATGKTLRYGSADFFGISQPTDTFTISSDANVALGRIVDGSGGVVIKQGAGQLILDHTANANTFAGTYDVQQGTLVAVNSSAAGSNNPLGSATVKLSGGSLLLDSKVGATTFNNDVEITTDSTISVTPANLTTTLGGSGRTINLPTGVTLTVATNSLQTGSNATSAVPPTLQISSTLSGPGGLTKTDNTFGTGGTRIPGTLILNGTGNNYTGATTLTSGTLQVQQAGGLGDTSAFTMAAGTSLLLNAANAYKATNPAISVPGTAVLRIGNATALNGDATFANDSVLEINAANPGGAGTITRAAGNMHFRLNNATPFSSGANTQFPIGMIENGDVVRLGADNIAGVNTLPGGVLFEISGANRSYTSVSLTLGTADGAERGALTLADTITNRTFTTSVLTIEDGGGVLGAPSGRTLTIAGNPRIDGAGNHLQIGSTTAIGGQTKTGIVDISGNNTTGMVVGSITIAAGTLQGLGGGMPTIVDGGTGLLTINSGATLDTRTGTLTNATVNVLSGGTARIRSANGTDNTVATAAIAGLQGAGNLFIGRSDTGTNRDVNMSVGINNASTTFSGLIQDADGTRNGMLTKVGSGTLTLSRAAGNTYTLGTAINNGAIVVTNTSGSGLGSGAVTVNANGTLGGTGIVTGPVTFVGGGSLSPGTSPGTITTGAMTLDPLSQLLYELGTPGTVGGGVNDLTVVNGNLTLDGVLDIAPLAGFNLGTYRLFNYTGSLTDSGLEFGDVPAGFAGSIDTNTGNQVNLIVTAVPEPASLGLLAFGAAGLLARRRRK